MIMESSHGRIFFADTAMSPIIMPNTTSLNFRWTAFAKLLVYLIASLALLTPGYVGRARYYPHCILTFFIA